MRFFLGLDLGQASDPTAAAILERTLVAGKTGTRAAFQARHLQRFPLGTPYPDIVTATGDLLRTPQLAGKTALVIDSTGVGRPVFDMFRAAKLSPVGITIHGGDAVIQDGARGFRVPKRDLCGVLQMLLQSQRLKIASSLPEAEALVRELLNFKIKINLATGHDSYEAWREAEHDDLVLALAVAAWYGLRAKAGRPASGGARPIMATAREQLLSGVPDAGVLGRGPLDPWAPVPGWPDLAGRSDGR